MVEGVLILGGEEFSENVIKGRGKLGNPYIKIKYKIMFFMPILKLIHLFSTSI